MATLDEVRSVRDLLRPAFIELGYATGVGGRGPDGYLLQVYSQENNASPDIPITGFVNGVELKYSRMGKIVMQDG